VIICEQVSCIYDDNVVFERVNLNLGEGALVILHGPNGSGKTSFLQIIAGIKAPSEGSVTWNGKNIGAAIRDGEFHLNYLGHDYAVKPELTVYENIEYWAKLSGNTGKIADAITRLGLGEYTNVLCAKMSDGWRKRVALARLIFCDADAWMLDEPYNNLDHRICEELDKIIEEKAKKGGIIMLSSHTLVPIDFADKLNIANFAPKRRK